MNILKRTTLVAMLIGSAFMLQYCGTSTKVIGSYSNPDAVGTNYSNVMVVALTSNVVARRAVEDQIVAALEKKGISATASINAFPPSYMQKQPTKDEVLDRIRQEGHDGVLTIGLLDQRTETRYVPGTSSYAPVSRYGYYGTFGGYYSTMYPTFYDPGYYTTDKTYVIETNLYDAQTEKLIWSAQTETYDPSNADSGAKSMAAAIADRMSSDGVTQ